MAGQKGRSGGHNRKPTSDLKASGGYRKDRHANRADQVIPPAQLTAPEHLGEIGRQAWKRIIGTLDPAIITALDVDSLGAYCDAVEAYRKVLPLYMAAPIDKDTRISFCAALANMDKLGRQFGWSPQSRAGLAIPQNEASESKFDRLLKRWAAGSFDNDNHAMSAGS